MTSLQTLISEVSAWADQDPESDYRDTSLQLLERLRAKDEPALVAARELFGSRLAFGTAGIRGPMRGGPNGMNRLVISQTTAGIARYLLEKFPFDNKTHHVVIGFDGRRHSETFARDTAEVFAGHGVRATLLPRMLPTPVLAFSVRELRATAGVMVTASHNPAVDNGYKVYFGGVDEGSQIIPPVDTDIETHIQRVAHTETWSTIPRSIDLVSVIDGDIVEKYLVATLNSLQLTASMEPAPTVVYTAMHGVGGETFLAAMDNAGFPEPRVVEEQFDPDPDFPTVEFPNPEEKGALDLSFEKARSAGADLIIAHDPDADRLAVALPDPSAAEGYRALTGNQVGAIFGWHIAHKVRSSGRTGTLANSLVSSPVLGKIADHFGLENEEALDQLKLLCDTTVITGAVLDVAPYYSIMTLLLLPTHREGFPNAVLEAAASGVPSVTTDVTGAIDSLVDGKTGILVQSGDRESFALEVRKLLMRPQLIANMGREARGRVLSDFDSNIVEKNHVAYFMKCAGSTNSAK